MIDDHGRHLDPLAKIHPTVVIGDHSAVWAFASLHDGVSVGQQCSVGEHVYVGRSTVIGDGSRIGQGAHITDHMRIGRNCFIAPHVVFCNDRHPEVNNPRFKRESPVVEDEVNIGVNATILPGVRLGRGCTVGAGAVVTKDVAPYTTVVGNPARRIARITERDLADHRDWCRIRTAKTNVHLGPACNCHPAFVLGA